MGSMALATPTALVTTGGTALVMAGGRYPPDTNKRPPEPTPDMLNQSLIFLTFVLVLRSFNRLRAPPFPIFMNLCPADTLTPEPQVNPGLVVVAGAGSTLTQELDTLRVPQDRVQHRQFHGFAADWKVERPVPAARTASHVMGGNNHGTPRNDG